MYKLTIEFKNKEELLAHLAGETATVAAVETSIAVDPVAEKKKAAAKKAAATRAANKAKKDAEASVVVEPSMTLPVFDRDGCLAAVIAKKDEVEKLGASQESVIGYFTDIFSTLGIAPMKITMLQDDQLSNFSAHFHANVDKLAPAAVETASFI